MLPREWSDSEIGNALENRDYIKLQQLFDSGRKFSDCIRTQRSRNSSFPPLTANVLYYAAEEKDEKLVKFLFKNGLPIEYFSRKCGGIILFYKPYCPEVFEILCEEAYKQIMKNSINVYTEMVVGVAEYLGIKQESFLYQELHEAAKAKNSKNVREIFSAIEFKKKGGKSHEN